MDGKLEIEAKVTINGKEGLFKVEQGINTLEDINAAFNHVAVMLQRILVIGGHYVQKEKGETHERVN